MVAVDVAAIRLLRAAHAEGGRRAAVSHCTRRRHPAQERRRRPCPAPCALLPLTPDAVFSVATVAVMPFYAAMTCAPRLAATARLISSERFYLAAAALYAALLALWNPLPQLWQVCSAALLTGGLPDVVAFAALFTRPELTALAWIHLLLLDLFQARLVFLDGLHHRVPTAHSAVLCFMVGPLGLLSHLVTKWAVQRRRRRRRRQELAPSPSGAA